MCGIAGVIAAAQDPAPILTRMVAALKHRGPDDEGTFVDPAAGIALGHRRLSVLDVTCGGHQPMVSADGRLIIVYNGEIYNFRELRKDLAKSGHVFRSSSDTEVLLAAYREWGMDCLQRLRGMWAFAIWDRHTRELLLARDRLGIKPLLYTISDGAFLFASEVRALLRSGLVPRALDRSASWHFLSYGAVPQPATIVENVRALPAGHVLRLREGGATIEPYWDVAAASRERPRPPAYPEAVAQLRVLLEDAVRYQLVSDVPVGAFLSGGIDSSAIVALASQIAGRAIRTFSVGFDRQHPDLDELRWARLVAERFGCEHTEVHMTERTVASLLDEIVENLDQPSIDGANTYTVAGAARRDVTVALSGLGGDELFAGYPHFRHIAEAARRLPEGIPMLSGVADAGWTRLVPGRVRRRLGMLVHGPVRRLSSLRRLMTERESTNAFSADFRDGFLPALPEARVAQLMRSELDIAAEVSYVELNTYLRDTLLRDTDAVSMAHGLEVRPVLLDHELVEFAFSLPAEYKLQAGRQKRILVDAVADLLPPEILHRPKRGFELPMVAWLAGPLRGRALDLLASGSARQLFDRRFLAAARRHVGSGRPRAYRYWSAVVLLAFVEKQQLRLGP